MALYQTLTAIVAAAYIGFGSMGNVMAEEPKKELDFSGWMASLKERGLISEQPKEKAPKSLSCEQKIKSLPALYEMCVNLDDGVVRIVSTFHSGNLMYVLKKEPGSYSYGRLNVFTLDDNYKLSDALFFKGCKDLVNCESDQEWVTACMGGLDIGTTSFDLNNPLVRKAAEKDFCKYFTQAVTQYETEQKDKERGKIQEQLDQLK